MTQKTGGKLIIRPARIHEVDRLRELGIVGWETTYADFVLPHNRQAYLDGHFWSLDRLSEIIQHPESLTLVAEIDSRVAGFLTLEPVEGRQVELTRLYVDPSVRRGGIGKALLSHARDAATASGAREMLVNVFADNHIGRAFYEREGFQLLRLEPTQVGDQQVGDAWYVMALGGAAELSELLSDT